MLVPTWATLLSCVGTALVLFTVPLSFAFKEASIPFIQLLMRGDILISAPLVDLMFGRHVRWWSRVALFVLAPALALEEMLARLPAFTLAGEIVPTRFPEIGALKVPLTFARGAPN